MAIRGYVPHRPSIRRQSRDCRPSQSDSDNRMGSSKEGLSPGKDYEDGESQSLLGSSKDDRKGSVKYSLRGAVDAMQSHLIGSKENVCDRVHVQGKVSILHLTRRFWHVAKAYFFGSAKWKARGLFFLVVVGCIVNTSMYTTLSYVQRDFSTALANKDKKGFMVQVWHFVGIVLVAAPLFATQDYLEDLLKLEWRVWLTDDLLAKYFSNRAFFDIKMEGKLDNPDQRISTDVHNFCSNTVMFMTLIIGKILLLFAFAKILWSISPGLVYFLLAYSLIGTVFTVYVFGRRLMLIRFEGLQKEADFRYSLVRVRENAESIAFYRGDKNEAAITKRMFGRLVVNLRELILWTRHLNLFNNFYEYATILIPSIIIAPRFFRGEVEFGVLTQTGYAFRTILAAMTVIISRFSELSGLAAEIERLDSLMMALEQHTTVPVPQQKPLSASPHTTSPNPKLHPNLKAAVELQPLHSTDLVDNPNHIEIRSHTESTPGIIARLESPTLALCDVSITTPRGQVTLFRGLSLTLDAGESLLVMGPSGCGKSSLLRAIAGLWTAGQGTIHAPKRADSFFLPQKAYMPLGSLRAQILFPHDEAEGVGITDDGVQTVLAEVALADLASRVGGLDAVCDWSDVLSTGEQQRVAFARLLLQKPKIAFLDEASSALDSINEATLYSLLQRRVGTYISVGHRLSLVSYHTRVMEFVDDGSWIIRTANEFRLQKGL